LTRNGVGSAGRRLRRRGDRRRSQRLGGVGVPAGVGSARRRRRASRRRRRRRRHRGDGARLPLLARLLPAQPPAARDHSRSPAQSRSFHLYRVFTEFSQPICPRHPPLAFLYHVYRVLLGFPGRSKVVVQFYRVFTEFSGSAHPCVICL